MAFLKNIPPRTRSNIRKLECPTFTDAPFVKGPALSARRVAIVSSAGLHHRSDARFGLSSADYRTISTTCDEDILMSHVSVNYDRTGYTQDLNTVLPIDRLREMAEDGVIRSCSETHYSFMGATDPTAMKPHADQVAGLLKADAVNAVLLVPV